MSFGIYTRHIETQVFTYSAIEGILKYRLNSKILSER